MSHPLPPEQPDWARRIFFGLVLVLVAGTVGYFWRVEYLTERCSALRYESVFGNPPPRPSEMDWYREHCWDGRPR